jgi:hypothetical protein
LIPVGAALLLDKISVIAAGIVMIIAGSSPSHRAARVRRRALRTLNQPADALRFHWALIATYSLWDKNALDELSVV